MMYSTIKKAGFILVATVGVSFLTACTGSNPTYMTYYMDSSCHYYYVDAMGNKVYDGRYQDVSFVGLPLTQGADGRWYYQDSFGNRVYKSKRCE